MHPQRKKSGKEKAGGEERAEKAAESSGRIHGWGGAGLRAVRRESGGGANGSKPWAETLAGGEKHFDFVQKQPRAF